MNYSSMWSGTHGPTDSEYRSRLFPGFPTDTAGGWRETGWEDLIDLNLRDTSAVKCNPLYTYHTSHNHCSICSSQTTPK